jgi:hypothetical protein
MFKLIILLSIIKLSTCESCSKSELLNPCVCNSEGISCGGNKPLNLKRILRRYSAAINNDEKHFKEFILFNTAINEIPENIFGDLTFETIYLNNALNLSRIHTNAFTSTSPTIETFYSIDTPLTHSVPNYDIFTALSSMKNLVKIIIVESKITEIPDNAFLPLNGMQTKLTELTIINSLIKRIGKNAFQYWPNLTTLNLGVNKIDYISGKAFNFLKKSNSTLNLYLHTNKLNSLSFHRSAFKQMRRPVALDMLYNEKITYLSRPTFESFLNQNRINKILVNSLDCNDCRSFWLIDNKYSDSQISRRECSNRALYNGNRNCLSI